MSTTAPANGSLHTHAGSPLGSANGAPEGPVTVDPPETEAPLATAVRQSVARTVVGQDVVVERILIALLTGGHLLLQGVPGLAKTLLVHAVAKAVDLQFGRVQFTVDLLPADIVGAEILEETPQGRAFRVHKGPIFTNLLLADEINRATPKVQSALLEAMQERRVTIGANTWRLPTPFLVIATQNPIEQAGTFELPEAQLDRFMLCHRLSYPTREQEAQVLRRSLSYGLNKHAAPISTAATTPTAEAAGAAAVGAVPRSAFDAIDAQTGGVTLADLTAAMEQVQAVHVSDVFLAHCIELVDRTRRHPDLDLGCSPRAGIALAQAARARAWLKGRTYAIPADLLALAPDVMLHRMRLSYDALARGRTAEMVLADVLAGT